MVLQGMNRFFMQEPHFKNLELHCYQSVNIAQLLLAEIRSGRSGRSGNGSKPEVFALKNGTKGTNTNHKPEKSCFIKILLYAVAPRLQDQATKGAIDCLLND